MQEEETIDSGNEEIRSGQGAIKFNSLANKIGEAGGKNAVYFAVALAEEEEKRSAGHNATDGEMKRRATAAATNLNMDMFFHSLEQPRQVMVRKAIRPTTYNRNRREDEG